MAWSTSRRRRSVASWSIEPAQAADAECAEAVAEVVELAVELRDRPAQPAGHRPVRRQLGGAVWVAQRRLGERHQQQALFVGQRKIADADRVDEDSSSSASSRSTPSSSATGTGPVGSGTRSGQRVVGDSGAEAEAASRNVRATPLPGATTALERDPSSATTDRDRAALVGEPPQAAPVLEPAEHPVQVGVLVDDEVGCAPERQVRSRLRPRSARRSTR